MKRATRRGTRMKTKFRAPSESNPLSSFHLLFLLHINTEVRTTCTSTQREFKMGQAEQGAL